MDQELDILNREVHPRLDGECLGDVDSRKRGVESEVEAVGVACLAVVQTGELLSIAVEVMISFT